MLCLSIETSCDETSLAILYNANFEKCLKGKFVDYVNSFTVLGQIISSQIDIHKEFGGVIPEIGAREHATQIHFLFQKVLLDAQQKYKEIQQKQENLKSELEILNPNLKSKITTGNYKNQLENCDEENLEKTGSANLTENQNYENCPNSFLSSTLLGKLDYIFVTTTPGLTSSLKVGIEFAKTLQFFIEQNYQKKVKIVPINHLQGHLASSFWQSK